MLGWLSRLFKSKQTSLDAKARAKAGPALVKPGTVVDPSAVQQPAPKPAMHHPYQRPPHLPTDKRWMETKRQEPHFEFEGRDRLCPEVLLCPHYQLRGEFTLHEIDAFVREKRREHPGHVLLATLDDVDQAFYTNGHAIMKYDLDRATGHDLSGLQPAQIEQPYGGGEVEYAFDFRIRHANFLKLVGAVELSELDGFHFWTGHDEEIDVSPSILLEDDPQANVRIDLSYVQVVPVQHGYEAISALPNGYFTVSFSPAQNYALARHLHESFGLELFGIGATYLGFQREEPLTEKELVALAELIQRVYRVYSTDPPLAPSTIIDRLRGATTVYLAYCEGG